MNYSSINNKLLYNYFSSLVNCFFKILPIREEGSTSITTYMESLESELLGCNSICKESGYNANILSLASILRYLIDNPECSIKIVKREVFKAISICNKLKRVYSDGNEV